MVTKETNGAFLFGYLVGVAGKLLLGKGVLGAFRRFVASPPLQLHPRLFCCRKEKGDTCVDVGGGWPPTLGQWKRGQHLILHLIAPPTNASLSPLNSRHALCSHLPLLCICC